MSLSISSSDSVSSSLSDLPLSSLFLSLCFVFLVSVLSPYFSLPLSRTYPLSFLGRNCPVLQAQRPPTPFFFSLSLCPLLSGSPAPSISVWGFSVALPLSGSLLWSVFLSHAHMSLPHSTQQALQLAKAVDEELEDLKSLAKSLEEQNRSLLAQARQTVGSGQGAQGCPLPSLFLGV